MRTGAQLMVFAAIGVVPYLADARPVRFHTALVEPDCRVHLTSDRLSTPRISKCNVVTELPAGEYLGWAVSKSMISADPTKVLIEPGAGLAEVLLPTPSTPAGTLVVEAAAGE